MDVASSSTERSANYVLNKDKQTSKIVNDSTIKDFNVTINNNDTNVNIKCSTGFYIQVARPCFATLEHETVLSKDLIAIAVDEKIKTNDRNGTESTLLLHFSFMSQLSSLGGVRVPLHHSPRMVRLQGSNIMPDNQRSPVWFLDNFVNWPS